jgi:erythromycin esterase-like protein
MGGAATSKAFLRQPKRPRFVTVSELLRRRDEGAPFQELFGSIGATRLGDQFDHVVHIDHTRAVEPLERNAAWDLGELPEVFPSVV